MELVYDNEISVKDYNNLRDEVKWGAIADEQAEIGLKNSAYVVSCKDGGKSIATARVIWDGGYSAYICDVMVSPEYQGMGIGSVMISKIMDYLKSQLKSGWKIMITLIAAEGKDVFYEKLGFIKRPNDNLGNGIGMAMLIK